MSDTDNTGFGKFVPGFDFLQNLAKGATETIPQMPNLSNWIAPTLNVEELDKRIQELKAVHFWLDQNSKALGATVQALEVQKMTLATLKGMNFNMGDVANAFKLKAADTVASSVQKVTEKASAASKTISEMAAEVEQAAEKAVSAAKPVASAAAAGLIDPMHLWGALTAQFQQIAANALQDAGKTSAAAAKAETTKPAEKATAKAPAKSVAKKATPTAKPRAAVKKTTPKVVKKTRPSR